MGRHKLPYKMKKPNPHHRYWRFVLSTDPKHCEITTRTKVKYEAERIAKEAYQKALEKQEKCISFGAYAKDFFSDKCTMTARLRSNKKSFSEDMQKTKHGQLQNYLLPQYSNSYYVILNPWVYVVQKASDLWLECGKVSSFIFSIKDYMSIVFNFHQSKIIPPNYANPFLSLILEVWNF